MTIDIHQPGSEPIKVDPAAGQLPGRQPERVVLSAIVAVVALFGLGWIGAVPRLPQPAPAKGPVVVFGNDDGLPRDLVAGRTYRGTVTVTLPPHWYDGTKANPSTSTLTAIDESTSPGDVMPGDAQRVIQNAWGFPPSDGRVLKLPVVLKPTAPGIVTVWAEVNLSGRATPRLHDNAEHQYDHHVVPASGTG
jgi:hypothetical protein